MVQEGTYLCKVKAHEHLTGEPVGEKAGDEKVTLKVWVSPCRQRHQLPASARGSPAQRKVRLFPLHPHHPSGPFPTDLETKSIPASSSFLTQEAPYPHIWLHTQT